ncbi:uncharacterized protein G2W53_026551 [Senna tora]|uniref:Transposase, Ptta/En/Spm, plant n=1 Tax=Senna tora TaxID=362788 RepID=A0A834THF1_9FABA|nr:uncharacterized protein G2W53_026551 [Senna tora]
MPRGVAKRKRSSLQGDVDHQAQQGDPQHDLEHTDDHGHHLQQGDMSHHSEHGDIGERGTENRIFLKRLYYWNEEDNMDIRSHFEHVGSVRLSNTMNKAKKEFYKKNTTPKWISEVHWKEMMVKEKGEEPSAAELFFMSHKTKKNEWFDTKSKAVWVKFKKIINKRIDDVSRMQDGNTGDEQVDEEETSDEEANEEDDAKFFSCQSLLSKEQVTSAWIEAVGGVTKGRLYGLGSDITTFVCGRDHTSMSTSTSTPTTHNFDSSDFQEAVNRVVEDKLSEMRARLQEDMQTTIQATIEAMRSSQPQI